VKHIRQKCGKRVYKRYIEAHKKFHREWGCSFIPELEITVSGPKYFIMDGRARIDPDRAIICSCCGTLREARKEMREDYQDFDYVIVDAKTMQVVCDPNGR
jgi:ssDNA-binding Zn-finger/Zn-ribbon topoisomerase 1